MIGEKNEMNSCVCGWIGWMMIGFFLLPAYQHFIVCEMRVVWAFALLGFLIGKS